MKAKKEKKQAGKKEENIFNVPNFFTTLRVLITFFIIYMIFNNYEIWIIAVFFVAGMITDAIDGNVARIFNMKTEFGRKYDLIADRFLFAGTIIPLIIQFSITGFFGKTEIIQILFIMSREIIGLPAAVYAFFLGNITPHAKVIGKTTTVLQAISLPAVVLKLWVAWPLAIITGVVGFFSGIRYHIDVRKESNR